MRIIDEPMEITDCNGRSFVILDTESSRITINGSDAMETARAIVAAFNSQEETDDEVS